MKDMKVKTAGSPKNALNTVSGVCLLAAGLILAGGTQFVFTACGIHDDGSYGRCHYAQLVTACIGLLVAVGALCSLFLKTREVSLAVSVITFCEALLVLLSPGKIIPLCMMATMHCLTMMKPFTLTMSLVILILAVGTFICNLTRKENKAS